jgi:hypothetical protein
MISTSTNFNTNFRISMVGVGRLDELSQASGVHSLGATLYDWTKQAGSADARERLVVTQTLSHWQQDADLASVRGDAIVKLPEAEQAAWRKLWQDLVPVLVKAKGG